MNGLYMISGVEDLTGNTLKDFYNNNKSLIWGTGLTIAAIFIYKSQSGSNKKNRKK